MPHRAKSFGRPSVFRVADVEEFSDVVTRFGATRVEVFEPEAFEAHASSIELRDIVLLSAAASSSLAVEYPEFDFARISLPSKGSGAVTIGGETIEVNQGQACVVSFGLASRVSCDREHQWFNLRIKRATLEQKLTSILGVRPKGDIDFTPDLPLNGPRQGGLSRLVEFLASQLHSNTVEYPPKVLQELEQAIVTAFLFATHHRFSEVLLRGSPDGSFSQLRQIEDYIEAHWHEAISIEALAEISGLSARSIFRMFRRRRGYSPMAFARTVRLRRAKELLEAPNETTTVSGVAFKCGFANHGHFARDYRAAFGQLPSETLIRSRAKSS